MIDSSDMPPLPLVLEYLAWEAGVAAVAVAAAIRFRPLAMRVPLFLSVHVLLSSLSGAALSHSRSNSPAAYRVLAAVFVLAGALLVWKRLGSLTKLLARLFQPGWQMLAMSFGLGALLALSIRPVEEGDSLYNLHYVMGWVNNLSTPYTFAYNYVPLWDLGSVPALVLTRSDYFFWFNSLKPILLLAAAMWLIARELRLPHTLAVWSIAALLTFPHLWLGPTGVSTNKNDMIHAAGYALLALSAVRWARGKASRADVVVVAFATAFVSVKASGPVMLLLSGVAIGVVARKRITENFRPAMKAAALAAAVWFIAAGHYYARNFLEYGNPVYPYSINFGPVHFPGRGDLSATSILYSLGYPNVWRFFFLPEGGVSPDGLLFPLILPALIFTSMGIVGLAFLRRRIGAPEALAAFQLLAWGVYVRSFYSASGWPGDLQFLRNDLNSTRYVEGPLLVGMLFLVWALHRLGAPRALIYISLAAQAASCFLILLRRAPDRPWGTMAACGVGLALGSLCLRRRALLPAGAALAALSLLAGTHLVERRRPLWMPALRPLYQPLYDAPASDLFYIIDDEFSPQVSGHWPMLGRRLQHSAASGSRRELAQRSLKPEFVAWLRTAPDVPPLNLPGYETVIATPQGMLLRRR